MPARSIVYSVALAAATAALVAAQPRVDAGPPLAAPVAATVPGADLLPPLATQPPAARYPADPADSLYRLARRAVTDGDFARAAELFRQLSATYPQSSYAADALYWEAYALFRQGGAPELRRARQVLATHAERFPEAAAQGDAPSLRARVNGALARGGDSDAAMAVVSAASGGFGGGGAVPLPPSQPSPAPAPPVSPAPPFVSADAQPGNCPAERDDERVMALNALLQMDADRALPMLERVLARRDECSASLRRRAVMMVAQKEGPRREEILLGVVRNDPDVRVREQGVFWLSQTQSERAVEILNDLLRTSTDDRLRDRALFGLSQQKSAAATRTLREFAERRDAPRSLRERAIFWLGQREGGADGAYLRELYGKLDDAALKERVLFSLSQASSAENQRFLLGVARNGSETAVLRGKAIFWLGQSDGMPTRELGALYEQMDDRQVKEQLVFAISQRTNDPEAVDVLMKIASSDDDRRLRERAIFWLGQSKDPRAVQYIMSIIDR